jgi:hypothetical protein
MEIVRAGAQYRKNLRFWGGLVALRTADSPAETTFCAPVGLVERFSGRLARGKRVFRQSRWAVPS